MASLPTQPQSEHSTMCMPKNFPNIVELPSGKNFLNPDLCWVVQMSVITVTNYTAKENI